MAVPWLRILDAAVGLTSIVRRMSNRTATALESPPSSLSTWGSGQLEARLAGVVVAALKEAFDRDHTRLEIEREQIEAERQRAERALRLELLRQAGDRELGRLRLLGGIAVASWLGTLFFSPALVAAGSTGRATLGAGWLLLLAALGSAFIGQIRIGRALDVAADPLDHRMTSRDVIAAGRAGNLAPWLIVAGLGAIAIGVLVG
jgi:hypothetical protein